MRKEKLKENFLKMYQMNNSQISVNLLCLKEKKVEDSCYQLNRLCPEAINFN